MDFDDQTIDSQESSQHSDHHHDWADGHPDHDFEHLEQDAVEQLALEAIDKIKTELLSAPSISSPLFSLNFAVVDDHVYARLERLGQLIDWSVRYKNTLEKLKSFLITHPRCIEEFEVKQDANNPIIHYVRCRHGEMVEVPRPSGLHRCASDELSVFNEQLPQEEAQDTKEEALALIREILLNQGSNNHMKLTLLNARSRWPQTYGRTFGSLKQWIRYLEGTGEAEDIKIIDNLGPGNDLVRLAPRRVLAQPPLQRLNLLPQQPILLPPVVERMDDNPRTPYFPPLLVESLSGVRVSDYFFLPLPTDLIEISYHRSMAQYTAMIRRWTEQRIIHECWSYNSDQFKKCEWLGDTVLRAEISKTLVLNNSALFDISGLDTRRQNAEQRLTMSLLFDELKLAQFVQLCPPSWVAGKWKAKCDFIEAVVGELSIKLLDVGERGIPFGHPEREFIQRFLRSVCEAALDRGAKMKSPQMRSEIDNDAQRPGSGGYLMEELDRQALNRRS